MKQKKRREAVFSCHHPSFTDGEFFNNILMKTTQKELVFRLEMP